MNISLTNELALTGDLLKEQDCVVLVTEQANIDLGRVVKLAPRMFDTHNATAALNDREQVERL